MVDWTNVYVCVLCFDLHVKIKQGSLQHQRATLYDGSILEFESRLHNFDIGSCLEVLLLPALYSNTFFFACVFVLSNFNSRIICSESEYMEEDQALWVLWTNSKLVSPPSSWLSQHQTMSTNTILQRSTPVAQEEKQSWVTTSQVQEPWPQPRMDKRTVWLVG